MKNLLMVVCLLIASISCLPVAMGSVKEHHSSQDKAAHKDENHVPYRIGSAGEIIYKDSKGNDSSFCLKGKTVTIEEFNADVAKGARDQQAYLARVGTPDNASKNPFYTKSEAAAIDNAQKLTSEAVVKMIADNKAEERARVAALKKEYKVLVSLEGE